VHAFVTAILLRVARLDTLNLDAETQPPHREPGKTEDGIGGGKGPAIIGSDGLGQAKVFESLFENGEREFGTCGLQPFAGQQVT
jgi:hypothetical protein